MNKLLRTMALVSAFGVTLAATGTVAQEKKKPADKDSKIGKVEIYESKKGFRFRIVGSDGKALCGAYKDYKTKDEATKAVEEIKEILTKTKPVDGAAAK